MNNCKYCGKETTNQKFCSRKCASIMNNAIFPKRKPVYNNCSLCSEQINRRQTYCKLCKTKSFKFSWISSETTMGNVRNHPTWQAVRNSVVRYHNYVSNKLFIENNKLNGCQKCSYKKYVEICHIKPIKDFENSALLTEVNSRSNLAFLCPNCHWELDNELSNPNPFEPREHV